MISSHKFAYLYSYRPHGQGRGDGDVCDCRPIIPIKLSVPGRPHTASLSHRHSFYSGGRLRSLTMRPSESVRFQWICGILRKIHSGELEEEERKKSIDSRLKWRGTIHRLVWCQKKACWAPTTSIHPSREWVTEWLPTASSLSLLQIISTLPLRDPYFDKVFLPAQYLSRRMLMSYGFTPWPIEATDLSNIYLSIWIKSSAIGHLIPIELHFIVSTVLQTYISPPSLPPIGVVLLPKACKVRSSLWKRAWQNCKFHPSGWQGIMRDPLFLDVHTHTPSYSNVRLRSRVRN